MQTAQSTNTSEDVVYNNEHLNLMFSYCSYCVYEDNTIKSQQIINSREHQIASIEAVKFESAFSIIV